MHVSSKEMSKRFCFENREDKAYCYSVRSVPTYDKSFPFFRKPAKQGYFSLGSNREFYDDDRELKYLCLPSPGSKIYFDLNYGYAQEVKKDEINEKLDNLLKWISRNKRKFSPDKKCTNINSLSTDFICYRGLLTVILCTPYEKQNDWEICATKFRGTIYVCAFPTEKDIKRKENETDRDKLMTAWGRKFEKYMISDKKNGKLDIKSPVNENEEYCVTVRTRLNNHSLIYGAEVDCIDSDSVSDIEDMGCYVELKTSRQITTDRQYHNFCRFKLLKWWAQSFLIGIPKIICGFRDDDGFVKELETFIVHDIPSKAENQWSASSCFNFCDEFLSFIKECVTEENPYTVYQFYWSPHQNITCRKLSPPGDRQILPDWYISDWNEKSF